MGVKGLVQIKLLGIEFYASRVKNGYYYVYERKSGRQDRKNGGCELILLVGVWAFD